jgi:hypothetical protein
MKKRVLVGIDGKEVVQWLPESDADRDAIRQMIAEGRMDPSDWLHRPVQAEQRKRKGSRVA